MDPEGEALLLEARESVEAARSYRRELQQRLRGLQQARKQVGHWGLGGRAEGAGAGHEVKGSWAQSCAGECRVLVLAGVGVGL
uniref:Cytokine receptor-like factor 3 n=1 Tax=Terrapene triunguis TaxID=2587831 RepID=A0A674JXM3_9SAUR